MKKCLSLFLAVILVFSVVPVSVGALGTDDLDAKSSFKITESATADNKITCTLSINENVSFCDAIFYVKYNKNAVTIVDSGACTKTVGGDEVQNVPGYFESGEVAEALYKASDLYSENESLYAFSYINSEKISYREEKDFLFVTFELVDGFTGKNEIDFIYTRSINDPAKQFFYKTTLNIADITDLSFVLNGDGNSYSISACDKTATGTMEIPLEYEGKPVTGIVQNAFSGCGTLTSFKVSDNNNYFSVINGVLFSKDGSELICFPEGKGNKYILPDSVKTIRSDAFPEGVTLSVYCDSPYAGKYSVVHPFSEEWTVDVPETCVTNGSKSHHCTKCSEKTDVTVIPAPGHKYSIEHTVKATCTEGGLDTYTCFCGDTHTEVVSPLGHAFSSAWTVDVEPTSDSTGIKSHHCIRCDAVTDVTVIHMSEPDPVVLESAVNVSNGVKLSWKAVSGADDYTICRKVGFRSYQVVDIVSGDCTSFVDTTAESGMKYTYTVFASNESGDGEYDETGITVRFITAPEAEVSLSSGGILIKWNETDGAEGYEIYRKSGSGSFTEIKTVYERTEVSYKDTTAKSGTKYTYYVKAYNGSSYSTFVETDEIYYLATPAAKTSNTSKGISVEWSKITGAKGYYVYRKAGSGSWSKIKTITSGSTVSYTDTKVKSGTKYSYYVKAYSDSTISSYKSTTALLYLATPTVKVSNTSKGISVKWSKITGAKGYVIYKKTGSGKWTKLKTISSGSTVSYTDTKVKSGTKYSYYVKAYNGKTYSSYKASSTLMFLTAVKLSSATSGKSGITLKWSKVSGAKGYYVYCKTGSGSYKKLATVKSGSTVKYVDKSAKKGTTYTYYVKAYNGSYTGSYANALKCKDKY